MTASVANNVISIAKGAHPAMAKSPHAKSKSDRPEPDAPEAEVTSLFPRIKSANSGWSKTQKSVAEGRPDSKTQDDADDRGMGQDLFGSLVTSVGQKLTQHDDRPAQPGEARIVELSPDASLLRVSQIMRHGVFPDSLQNVTQKPIRDVKSPVAISKVDPRALPSISTNQPALESGFADEKIFVDLGQTKGTTLVKSSNVDVPPRTTLGESQPVLANDDAPANLQSPMPEREAKSTSIDKPAPGSPKESLAQQSTGQVTSALDLTPVAALNSMGGKLLSPTAQILENIKSAVPPAPAAPVANSVVPQAVKTLEIQLLPEGLGPVTVSLKSEQGKLKVQISAKLDTTRQELERNSAELVSGLRAVDPTFTDVDVNFSDQNQGTAPDSRGQAFGNGGEGRGAPENTSGFGSNGGRDADQASPSRQNSVYGKTRPGQNVAAGELPSRISRADGIYL